MSRSWSLLDFVLIWLGGLLGMGVFFALGVAFGDQDLLILFSLAGQYVGNLAVLLLLGRRKDDGDLGFEIKPGDFGYIALGLISQIGMAVLIAPLAEILFPDGQPTQNVADAIANADSTLLIVGFVSAAVILAPVTEELMFRGVLLRALEPRGKRFAMVVSAFLFSSVHLLGVDTGRFWQSAVVVIPPIFLLGLVLAWLTQRNGRLGPAIFLHSGWNLLAAFVLLLPPELIEQAA